MQAHLSEQQPGIATSPALLVPACEPAPEEERSLPPRPTPVITDKYARLWTQRQLDAYAKACYDAGLNAALQQI